MVKQLNILDLHRCIYEKKNRANECFEKVLEICHRKIKCAAENQQVRCFIEVPCFVLGYPLFDFTKCVEFVYEKLKKNGFLIKYYFPKHLYISWDFDEINNEKDNDKKLKSKPNELTYSKPKSKNSLSYKPSGKLELNLD